MSVDFFSDGAASLFGDDARISDDDEAIRYGPLTLRVAPKEGKANTLLADHLFSPGLLLAERIERGLIRLHGKTVIELGAGCALPSLLLSTLSEPPSLVVVTDYPDNAIMSNLKTNVETNRFSVADGCIVRCEGYEWGKDVRPLLDLLPPSTEPQAYDTVILSDLLHFDASHSLLLTSLLSLLRRSQSSRTYVAAGKYTPSHVCDHFLREAEGKGLVWEGQEEEGEWYGRMEVRGGGLEREGLGGGRGCVGCGLGGGARRRCRRRALDVGFILCTQEEPPPKQDP